VVVYIEIAARAPTLHTGRKRVYYRVVHKLGGAKAGKNYGTLAEALKACPKGATVYINAFALRRAIDDVV